jgi:DNA modification methylase
VASQQKSDSTRKPTVTSAFGVGRRENHDASDFYARFTPPELSSDDQINVAPDLGDGCILGDARDMSQLPDSSVALVVTSPPYFVGKEYEQEIAGADVDVGSPSRGIPTNYLAFLEMLREVFAECQRVLEPGGRMAVNVANLGRKPYRSLSADVIGILQDDLGLLLRGEIIWQKAEGATGSLAWGSYRSATNPVLRDLTERVIVVSKGRFDRARNKQVRLAEGLPTESTLSADEFMEATLDVWRIDPESARRVKHPAPFPIELPRRLIDLYTFRDDVVVDPFMGSGTTLVAAARTERRGVGYDLDSEYVETARERVTAERSRRHFRPHTHIDERPLDLAGIDGQLWHDPAGESVEHFQARATAEGKKAQDIAERVLTDAGFEIVAEKPKVARLGLQFNFLITDQVEGRQWYVDVSGAFTTVRPGLMRTDTLWKMLGRVHVLKSNQLEAQLLVLTSNLPRPGSEGDKALRSVGPDSVFDAIEIFDRAGQERLHSYADGDADTPLQGFWSEDDIAQRYGS